MPNLKINKKVTRKAINWNRLTDDFSKIFWDQNIRQFWVDEEISLAEDKKSWLTLSKEEQTTYEKVLAGLTLLDTEQGGTGMPLIMQHVEELHAKAVLTFMGAMEQVHAKSYSTIFSTLSTMDRIDELFKWVENNEALQSKTKLIVDNYTSIKDDKSLYIAMASSVLLETYLFYSGFFYPLYLSGQGKMIGSGEIINLIIRDESVHGLFIGLLAQGVLEKIPKLERKKLIDDIYKLMLDLFELEKIYTKELYEPIGLEEEVVKFVKYNADKALMNLGLDPYFNIEIKDINPIVLNGLDTETKTHDFFSTKGNGYIKALKHEDLNDEDFDW
ncbi:MAG: class 1b ribonucleoside-diphosphate reductase subunit beta [Mycoplasmataceae bacterium]|nr:class 1b ribonucleoside-diphosphate reductase subunit beta [Mycoplasmataceae bacterium]